MTLEEQNALVVSGMQEAEIIAALALRKLPKRIDAESVKQSALLGLVEASRRYDPTQNVQFLTYAKYRIQRGIFDYLRSIDPAERSHHIWKKTCISFETYILNLWQRLPREEEYAAAFAMSVTECRTWQQRVYERHEVPMDDVVEILTTVAQRTTDVEWKERYLRLTAAFGCLSVQQKKVMTLYYSDEYTLTEIGECLGISVTSVWRLKQRAEKAMKAFLAKL